MRLLRAVLLLACFLTLSCTAPTGAETGLGMHVTWDLVDPSATIPSGVVQLTIFVYPGDDPTGTDSGATVENLMDSDGNGRNEVTRADLPTGEPLRVIVRGEGASGNLLYIGHAGPLVLEAGERRYIDLQMFPVGDYGMVNAGVTTGRFLHTATSLPDGRVLIAGGFTRAMSTTCPASSPAMTTCFDLTGNSEAFVYDPATARFSPVQGGMRQARGGHTATLLGDGRVLIAGGAARAMLLLTPQTGGVVPSFTAMDDGGAAATSFEMFLPDANAEDEDLERNGDPARGGFVGAADDPMMLGRLDRARFLHAASVIPGSPNRVALVGGLAGDAAQSWAVFDGDRAGGYGVLDSATNLLGASRSMPTTIAVGAAGREALWFLGGGDALDNGDLGDRYSSMGGNGNGSLVPPGAMNMFPSSTARPELNLWRPTAIPLGDGTRAIVVGWLGPACEDGMTAPVFPTTAGTSYVRCGYDMAATRSFTLAETGLATATTVRNAHAFGAGARLSDGTAIVTGGFVGLGMQTNNTTDHFAATVGTAGTATLTEVRPLLRTARAFHTMSALEGRGVLVFGGMSRSADGTAVTISAAPEVLYLP